MESIITEIEDELDFDTDDIENCLYAVCITGLNKDGAEGNYFKTVQIFSDSDAAIAKAWQIDEQYLSDRPKDMTQFLVTVEEAVKADTSTESEYDFVGTIFRTELVL